MTTSMMSREPVFDENAISREITYQKEGSKVIDWASPNGEIYRARDSTNCISAERRHRLTSQNDQITRTRKR